MPYGTTVRASLHLLWNVMTTAACRSFAFLVSQSLRILIWSADVALNSQNIIKAAPVSFDQDWNTHES